MPKSLYLLRHAAAAEKESRQDDKSRDLTQAGVQDAIHMGTWFRENNIHWDLIISSSAIRAERTASLIVEVMKVEQPRILLDDTLFEASVRQFLSCVNNIEDVYHNVLIVGHNPSISYLAEYLTKADIGNMPPGSAAIIRFELNSWKHISENTGMLEKFATPGSVAKF